MRRERSEARATTKTTRSRTDAKSETANIFFSTFFTGETSKPETRRDRRAGMELSTHRNVERRSRSAVPDRFILEIVSKTAHAPRERADHYPAQHWWQQEVSI